jgi:hypothetical protein
VAGFAVSIDQLYEPAQPGREINLRIIKAIISDSFAMRIHK